MTKRDTTLHLLFTHRDGRSAIHTVNTDQTTYFGANITEEARKAGIEARLLRRIHFKFHGERDGVNYVDAVWHLQALEGTEVNWQQDFTEAEQAWLQTAPPPSHPGFRKAGLPARSPGWTPN